MSASVIACVNAPPVFEFSEHIFHFMTLSIEIFIEASGQYPSLSWRDARRDAFGL